MLNKNLSRFQRRSLQLFSVSILSTAGLTWVVRPWFNHHQSPGSYGWLLALLPTLPFLATLLLALRYLAREHDEYIRAQVLLALLHGSFITLALTVFYGFLQNIVYVPAPPAMAYVDVFLISSMFALRFHLRRSID